MTPRGPRAPRASLILILTGFLLVVFPAAASALSARDLIIVYNRNLPDSQGVAAYYAGKRHVPLENLVGVDVPVSEDLSRSDYDHKLVPPLKAMVDRFRARGKTPAILLVYGIPLRVRGVPLTKADQELKSLANTKVKEYQEQLVQMVIKLDQLTGAAELASLPKLTYPPVQTLKNAEEAIARATSYLQKPPVSPADEATRKEITALLVQLRGVSPEAMTLMAKMGRRQGRRQALRQKELLGSDEPSQEELQEEIFHGIMLQTAQKTAAAIRSTNGLMAEMKFWYEARSAYDNPQSLAAVDSELTLVAAGPYQKVGWLPNPFNLRYDRLAFIRTIRAASLMVGRLDGPTPAIARRLVDDALEVEKTGLTGVFYIDARGLSGTPAVGNYVWFDQHLLHLHEVIKKYSDMKAVLDNKPAVFAPGSCPDAALYCGWYSLSQYVPAFKWNKGAVGYHVASLEASTLKQPGSNVWCKRMLEEGVAATLGPVTEPYLHSFPLPDQFFPLLMTGKLTLLEVYFLTVPQVSWMQVLIGDPLYCPFRNKPAIRPPGPAQP
jgi:uncharacterized protein (TIGR03790 family)